MTGDTQLLVMRGGRERTEAGGDGVVAARHLTTIWHWDKVHRTGFARMVLDKPPRVPGERFAEFMTVTQAEAILRAYDNAQPSKRRTCELMGLQCHDNHLLLFIRRSERPDRIIRDENLVHGYRPEWIVLDFLDEARRVQIASQSQEESLRIADRLASSFFEADCFYRNERQTVCPAQIHQLLAKLLADEAPLLELVEVAVNASPLRDSPSVKIFDKDCIAAGLAHFEQAVAPLFGELDHFEGIKVRYRAKRILLKWNSLAADRDQYVVRYSDKNLDVTERRAFEDDMRTSYGIPVTSTEKRFKNPSVKVRPGTAGGRAEDFEPRYEFADGGDGLKGEGLD